MTQATSPTRGEAIADEAVRESMPLVHRLYQLVRLVQAPQPLEQRDPRETGSLLEGLGVEHLPLDGRHLENVALLRPEAGEPPHQDVGDGLRNDERAGVRAEKAAALAQ